MLTNQATVSRRSSRLKGRSQRTQSVGTKLTPQEEADVLSAAEDDGMVPSEWVRDLIMRELRTSSTADAMLAEVLGVRLLLVNVLRPLASGQKLSAEAFDKLLDDIGATKYELATKVVAERRR
jgi:hypothetical protein